MSGWIKIHREIQDHWIWQERREFSKLEAWLDILLTVNHADNKVLINNKLYTVKRGESLNSLVTWSKRWNWSKSRVKRFFDLLQKQSMIELKSDQNTTHLTVCNYDSYQGERNTNETQTKRRRNADETQTDTNKNEKNEKNDKNDKNIKERENKFRLQSQSFKNQFSSEMIDRFCDYWTEPNKSNTKMKFELQKTFDIERRLKTWDRNNYGNRNTNRRTDGRNTVAQDFWE